MKKVQGRKILADKTKHIVVDPGIFPYAIDEQDGEAMGFYCANGERVVRKIDRFRKGNLLRSGRYSTIKVDRLEISYSTIKEDYGTFTAVFDEMFGSEEE